LASVGHERCVAGAVSLADDPLAEEIQMPKRTYQPKRIPRKREHGFMKRMKSRGGRAVLAARRRKGRHQLSVSDERKPTLNK